MLNLTRVKSKAKLKGYSLVDLSLMLGRQRSYFQPPELTQPNSKSLIREALSWVELSPLSPTCFRCGALIDTAIDTDKCYTYFQDGRLIKSSN